MTTITERVAAGMAFLDEHDPEWWRPDVPNAIDVDKLLLSSGDLCVLGQRCPLDVLMASEWDSNYFAFAVFLSGIPASEEGEPEDRINDWASALGFQWRRGDPPDGYELLTAHWRTVITGRRSAS